MAQCQCRRCGFDPWVGKILWGREWQPSPVFLPGESHRQRSLGSVFHGVAKESDTTERLNNSNKYPCHLPYIPEDFYKNCEILISSSRELNELPLGRISQMVYPRGFILSEISPLIKKRCHDFVAFQASVSGRLHQEMSTLRNGNRSPG